MGFIGYWLVVRGGTEQGLRELGLNPAGEGGAPGWLFGGVSGLGVPLPDGEEIEGAHVHAGPGEEGVAVFTQEPGTCEAWCTIPGHYESGMKGEVVANQPSGKEDG